MAEFRIRIIGPGFTMAKAQNIVNNRIGDSLIGTYSYSAGAPDTVFVDLEDCNSTNQNVTNKFERAFSEENVIVDVNTQ